MSLYKKIKVDHNSRRDSFGVRVCHDLSEILLQFLPIQDKLRLECVSKQFQRTVFTRHHYLIIEEIAEKLINCLNVTKLLKKFSNIRSLTTKTNINDIIESIIQNCNQLKEIKCNLSQISDQMRDTFAEKFGQQLVSISATINDLEMIEKSFPNIQEIDLTTFGNNYQTVKRFSIILLKNLKKLSFGLEEDVKQKPEQVLSCLRDLFANNKSLKHLTFRDDNIDDNITN